MSDPRNEPSLNQIILAGAAYLGLLLLVISIHPVAGVTLCIISALAALIVGAVYALVKKYKFGRGARVQSLGGRMRERMLECLRLESKFRGEADSIKQSIDRLQDDLERSKTAPQFELDRGKKIIESLKAEFDLRHTKALFFADCATRLRQLIDRYELNESITAHQRKLEALRSTNFDDEAAVEETRYHLEQDGIQLETISELTKDVGEYFKTEQAEELRERLESLRKNILNPVQPKDGEKS